MWRKSYAGEGATNYLVDAEILADGSIVSVGMYGLYDNVDYNGVILKVDKNGNPQWMREYNNHPGMNSWYEGFGGIDRTLDGGFLIVGSVPLDPQGKAWVLKTDSMGCVVPGCASMTVSVDSLLLDPVEPEDPVDPGDTTKVSLREFDLNNIALAVFPNPAKDFATIRHSGGKPFAANGALRVFTANGLLYQILSPLSESGEEQLDMSAAAPGIYLVQLLYEGRVVQNAKLVRE